MKQLLDFWIPQPLVMQRIKRAFFEGREPGLREEIQFLQFLNANPPAEVLWELYKQGGRFMHESHDNQKKAIF